MPAPLAPRALSVPPRTDYTYVWDKAGGRFELNTPLPSSAGALGASWAVEKLTGLDLPDFAPATSEADGQHGGIVHVRYAGIRTLIAEGTLYADPDTVDAEIERIQALMTPDNLNHRWWFKHPGVPAKYINAKAAALKYDIDTARRTGRCAFQAQWLAEDPRKHLDNPVTSLPNNQPQTIENRGPVASFPVVTVAGNFADLLLVNFTTGLALRLPYDTEGEPRTLIVDFRDRSVRIGGPDGTRAAVVARGDWWSIQPGINQIKASLTTLRTATSVQLSSTSAWL